MPAEAKSRRRAALRRAVDLPPPFSLVNLREVGDAFAHACKIAADRGAGTLVHVGRFDLAEFAVVLEPEEALREARRAFYAAMAALGEALAALAPPERPVDFAWPDSVLVDGGLVGGGRLGWPAGASEEEPPAWLVFGAVIRTVGMGEHDAGLYRLGSALDAEGFDGADSSLLMESFARHLMLMLDRWRERGFDSIARTYLDRLPRDTNLRRRIDANGDLLVRHLGQEDATTERRVLYDRLLAPSWLDAATGTVK